ncbi:hypothetical protein AA313_de0209442 [Arthrobotrys entomopaga]|nr:hypothetical protein AA313_de0209442 [Arthrobotrys entomopaga]
MMKLCSLILKSRLEATCLAAFTAGRVKPLQICHRPLQTKSVRSVSSGGLMPQKAWALFSEKYSCRKPTFLLRTDTAPRLDDIFLSFFHFIFLIVKLTWKFRNERGC